MPARNLSVAALLAMPGISAMPQIRGTRGIAVCTEILRLPDLRAVSPDVLRGVAALRPQPHMYMYFLPTPGDLSVK
jgi:hypothetical protein